MASPLLLFVGVVAGELVVGIFLGALSVAASVGAQVCGNKTNPHLSYGPPWAHYLGGYQDRLLGGPLGLPGLRYTAPEGVEHKDYTGVVLG
jgi:hypothetical protein